MTIKAAIDQDIMRDPFPKEMPDYIQLAKDKFQTLDELMIWLGLTDDDLGDICKGVPCSEDGTIYHIIFREYESQIETKFIGEM